MQQIVKERNVHLGGRCEYAKAEVWWHHSNPSNPWDQPVFISNGPKEYERAFVQGLRISCDKQFIFVVRLTEHPVDSCEAAFTRIGRQIGEEIISFLVHKEITRWAK
jgi:hypothetical protein